MSGKKFRFLAVPAIALAALAIACGGDDAQSPPTDDSGRGIVGSGRHMVDPNARLVFQGKTYRLIGFVQEDLPTKEGYAPAGTITSVNIDSEQQAYRGAGDPSVYTRAIASSESPDANLWMQWSEES